jgi:hypothetical protein
LEQVIQNINTLFSEVEPFTEEWASKSSKWQRIRADIVLKKNELTELNELAHRISEFLIDRGFMADSTNISETITAFKKGHLCVMIRLNASPEPKAGENSSIDVISGIEK